MIETFCADGSMLFGAAAQHSRFCLRAATLELSNRLLGPRLSVWLIAFCAAVLFVQGLQASDVLDVSQSRQIANTGSMSGAIIGGLMFGVGMVLARGCASRLRSPTSLPPVWLAWRLGLAGWLPSR